MRWNTHLRSRRVHLPLLAVLGLLGAAAPRAGAQPCEAGDWIALEDTASPPLHQEDTDRMTYDAARQVIVANLRSGTWEWDGQAWTLRASDGPLGPIVYDTWRRHCIVLTLTGETWRWDGDTWARIGVGGPGGGESIAFDDDRGVVVLYVGEFFRQTTWEWDGTGWTLRYQNTTDPELYLPLYGTALCYDSDEHHVVMHGGTWHGPQTIGGTWTWDGAGWVFERAAPRRSDAGLVFDSRRGRRVLFGGFYMLSYAEILPFGETYESSAGTPWQLVSETGPSPRFRPMMAYDAARDEIVLLGGLDYFFGLADTFTWVRRRVIIDGGPIIGAQPQDARVPLDGEVRFIVEATGEQLRYQWRKDGVPVLDSRRIHGARTAVLTVAEADVPDEGAYDVVVTNPCGTVTSRRARLDVLGVCPADFNADSVVNSQDFFDYLTAFFASAPSADFDDSGTVDSGDFFAYLDAFFAGCV